MYLAITEVGLDDAESHARQEWIERIPSFQQKAELNLQLSIPPFSAASYGGLLEVCLFVYQIS